MLKQFIFTLESSIVTRQLTLDLVHQWMIDNPISEIKKNILMIAIDYAKLNFLDNTGMKGFKKLWKKIHKKTNPTRIRTIEIIFQSADQADILFIKNIIHEMDQIKEKHSSLKRKMGSLIKQIAKEKLIPSPSSMIPAKQTVEIALVPLVRLPKKNSAVTALQPPGRTNFSLRRPSPLNTALVFQPNLFQDYDEVELNYKIQNFHRLFNELQSKDGLNEIVMIFEFVSASCFNVTFVLLLCLGTVLLIYKTDEDRNYMSKLVQNQLAELFAIYKRLTTRGVRSTFDNKVIILLNTLAPFIPTQDLIHWDKKISDDMKVSFDDLPSLEVQQILSTPPHNIFYAKTIQSSDNLNSAEKVQNCLELKQQQRNLRYGFFEKAASEVTFLLYGLEQKRINSQSFRAT